MYVEEDKAKKCVNYPTEKYQSYRDCADQYVQTWLPKNYRPIWAVDNFHNITENVFLEEYPKGLGNLIDGTQPPDCPLPCSTTTVDARIMTYSKWSESSYIYLTFNPTVLKLVEVWVCGLALDFYKRWNCWLNTHGQAGDESVASLSVYFS